MSEDEPNSHEIEIEHVRTLQPRCFWYHSHEVQLLPDRYVADLVNLTFSVVHGPLLLRDCVPVSLLVEFQF